MKESVYPVDEFGMPGTNEREGYVGGGDSAAILGTILTLGNSELVGKFYDKMPLLLKDGIPVRSPSLKSFGDKNRFSRDQLIPVICAGIRDVFNPTVHKIFAAHKKHFFLYAWNTRRNGEADVKKIADPTLFQVWALWLRYKKPFWRVLILWFCDLEHLIGTFLWMYRVKNNSGDRITRNHMLISFTSFENDSTFISRLSFRLTPFMQLASRWEDHCKAVEEYQTADLFRVRLSLHAKNIS